MVKSRPWRSDFYGVRCSEVARQQVQGWLLTQAMPEGWPPWGVTAVHLELFEVQEASLWRW